MEGGRDWLSKRDVSVYTGRQGAFTASFEAVADAAPFSSGYNLENLPIGTILSIQTETPGPLAQRSTIFMEYSGPDGHGDSVVSIAGDHLLFEEDRAVSGVLVSGALFGGSLKRHTIVPGLRLEISVPVQCAAMVRGAKEALAVDPLGPIREFIPMHTGTVREIIIIPPST